MKNGTVNHTKGANMHATRAKSIKIIPTKTMKVLVTKLTNLPVKLESPNIGTKRSFILVVKEMRLSAVAKSTIPIFDIFKGILVAHQ